MKLYNEDITFFLAIGHCMELTTELKSHLVQTQVREVGINPNHWYPVGWAKDWAPGTVQAVTIWQQAIALYRDESGHLHALANFCPHRGVELHLGRVQGQHLACAYHGWKFNGETGDCVEIPYLPAGQKLPCAHTHSYPVREQYGIIWVFPGDPALATLRSLPEIPEYEESQWLMIPITGHFKAHFSICNENTMDVFHGFLHQKLQGWFDPVLKHLSATEATVDAVYNVSYKGRMAKFLGLSETATAVTTLPIEIHYRYPHYHSALQGVSSLYLMRSPVGPQESRSFALFFFRVRLPQWILRPLAPVLAPLLRRFVLEKFLAQDVDMIESEQKNYRDQPQPRYLEINPAIIAIQRVTVRQYEEFMQQSRQSLDHQKESSAGPAMELKTPAAMSDEAGSIA